MTAECDCGFEAKNATGLSAHQRACDEAGDDDSENRYDVDDSVSTAVADAVFERDSEKCMRCESTDSLTIHRYDEEGESIPQNLVTLCGECDALLEGGTPQTKRSQVGR